MNNLSNTKIDTNVKTCNNNCPICLEVIKDGIITNCGHTYCTDCTINLLKHHYENNDIRYYLRNINGKICCPLCKQRVHIFTPMSSSYPLDSIINNYNNDIYPNQDFMTRVVIRAYIIIFYKIYHIYYCLIVSFYLYGK